MGDSDEEFDRRRRDKFRSERREYRDDRGGGGGGRGGGGGGCWEDRCVTLPYYTFTKFKSLQLQVPFSHSVQKWQGCTNHEVPEFVLYHKHGNCQIVNSKS